MKRTTTLALLLFTAVYFAIGQTGPFRIQATANQANHPDSFSLPFTEDWSSGSLETNNWTTECDNWTINYQQGNENPSVEFTWDPWFQNEYSCSLVSDVFDGDILKVGQIMLDFDIRLDSRQATGYEKLLVEVFDGTDWDTIAEFVNDGNIDWLNNSIDISDYALGHTFQIRFNATGQNSFHILSWFVDNISIYRVCEAPSDIQAQLTWLPPLDSNKIAVELNWMPPENTTVDKFFWKYWGADIHSGGIGLTDGGIFSVAAQWDSLQLATYAGDTLETIRFFLNDSGYSEVVVKIWTGEEADNLIYNDTIDNPIPDSWNEHILDTAILINPETYYRIGYTIVGQPGGYFPAGYEPGPAIPGYGDLIKIGDDEWEKISDLGMDYNFNIQMKLLNNYFPDTTNCAGFNIYRQRIGNDPDYSFYHFTSFDKDIAWYEFFDKNIVNPWHEVYCYKVEAVWANNGDTCISEFAKTIGQFDDYTCAMVSSITTQTNYKQLNIYPNPATNQLNITDKDEKTIDEIRIYNLTGQLVFQGQPQNNSIDISQLQAGMYVVEVVSGKVLLRKKLLVR